MKIFFPIGAFYPSQIGGPCNTLYWHCCTLKKNNIEPTVITTTKGIEKNQVFFDEWIESECGDVYYSTKGVFSLSTIKLVAREIANTDILHLNSLFSSFSIFSFFYKTLFFPNKKVVWSVRGELNENALKYSSLKKKPLLFIYKLFNKNIVYHSTSKQENEGIEKVFPKNKVIEIPNFISPSKRLNETVGKNLLFVGRIHPIKSLDKLIKGVALSKMFMETPSKLYIIGKHEVRHDYYKEKLISLIKELRLENKVVFKGHMEGEEKEKMYARSYSLILPSETENFGNVVVESLNQGTPVIASKGAPWTILEEYNAGYHVSNNPEMLSIKIDQLFNISKDKYLDMRKNSIKLVDEKFNIDSNIHVWVNTYRKTTINK